MGRAFEYRRASKEKRWDKMSKLFPKLATAITIAAKEGGSDPSMNAKLRSAITNAKAQNMPKDNIDSAIKRASGKEGQYIEITYEGKCAHGVMIFIECITNNSNRTIANIKSYFNKTPQAQIIPNGSLEFMFARKSVFDFDLPDNFDIQEVELSFIDCGLEELEKNEDGSYRLYGDYKDFGRLNEGFEKLGIPYKKAKLERISNSPITLSDAMFEEVEKLIDMIEEDDDVQAVYTNIA